MNFGKSSPASRQSGNAMIYILLALALLALLTASLMSQDSTGGDDISADQVAFQVTEILGHAAAAQNVIDQMVSLGADPASIDFVLPTATSFDTTPLGNKFYHPQGGGFVYKAGNPKIFTGTSPTPPPGWYVSRFSNTQWTPTTAHDIIIAAYQISKPVCEAINKKITGSTTVPTYNGALSSVFLGTANGAGANNDFTSAACPGCNGKPTLCVSNFAADAWAYYSILLGR